MPLVFVCESFARSGKHHSLMDNIPFIAHGAVQGSLISKNHIIYLKQGEGTIAGEIYEVSDARWEAFLFSVNKICAPQRIEAKSVSAKVRGFVLECFALTLA